MNRQPPALLERLVGRLIPAKSREHVLGDLSERYRSTSQYMVDAGRTMPFVWAGQWRRSRVPWPAVAEAACLQFLMLLVLLPLLAVWVHLEQGVTTPRWFSQAWIIFLVVFCFFVNRAAPRVDDVFGSVDGSTLGLQRQALMRRVARQQRLLRFSAAPGVMVSAAPLLTIAAARLGNLATPAFDVRMVFYYAVLVLLCICFSGVVRADNLRRLRNLRQELDAL